MAGHVEVTPIGITEAGKNTLRNKLSTANYTPEQINDVIATVDSLSRDAMLNRPASGKIKDFGKSMTLGVFKSTDQKMTAKYDELFKQQIPEDVEDLKNKIRQVAQNTK